MNENTLSRDENPGKRIVESMMKKWNVMEKNTTERWNRVIEEFIFQKKSLEKVWCDKLTMKKDRN